MELLNDFSPSPLDRYRKLASFDWKKLKIQIETEDIIRYKDKLVEELKKHPLCHPTYNFQSLEDVRKQADLRSRHLLNIPDTHLINMYDNVDKFPAHLEILGHFDPSTSVKNSLNRLMFLSALQASGTDKHHEIAEKVEKGENFGCFCLTEIGHGSNTKGMRTRATFDKLSKDFVMHTPDFEAAKCWAGNLAKSATHALVFAQLYTPDGVCHGLHQFVIQIRDEKTLHTFPGITIGDMGEKVGLNGLDNGFLIFDHYHVPRDTFLNRNGDVNDDGVYVTYLKDPSKRSGSSFSAVSYARLTVGVVCTGYLTKAISIAIRYSAVRKQFGPDGGEEIPILEYQLQQHRLIPFLASTYVMKIFSVYIARQQFSLAMNNYSGQSRGDAFEYGTEMHVISSAIKPIYSWLARDGIQECRESCGGHGYLKASRLGDLRNDNDPVLTYDGDNNVLLQQCSNWLVKNWASVLEGKPLASPLHSVDFLNRAKDILQTKCEAQSVEEISQPEYIARMYQWLVSYLVESTYEKFWKNISAGKSEFEARNDSQVYFAKNLGFAYIEHFMLQTFIAFANEVQDIPMKNVLRKLAALFGLFRIEKHIARLYQGGFFVGKAPNRILQEAILSLCYALKDDAVALVDVIAPCDFLLNSVLGSSDGQVYKNLQSAFYKGDNVFGRPSWWEDIGAWKSSKL